MFPSCSKGVGEGRAGAWRVGEGSLPVPMGRSIGTSYDLALSGPLGLVFSF